MNAGVAQRQSASSPSWWRRFDSYRPLSTRSAGWGEEMADSPLAEEEEMLAALALGFLGTILVGIVSLIIVWLVRRT
jgi:hypothetical protein